MDSNSPSWSGPFSLDSTSNVNVTLSSRGDAGSNADIRVYQDKDSNSTINPDTDLLIGSSTRAGGSDESINLESLAPGAYMVEAYLVSGNSSISLSLSIFREIEVIGTLNSTQTFSDFVGDTDSTDLYRFSLANTSNLNVALTGMNAGGDANIHLYEDVNSNGVKDAQDNLIDTSDFGGNHDEEITRASLAAGNYLVEVSRASGNNIYYDMSLSTTSPSDLLPREHEVDTLIGTRTFQQSVGDNDPSDVYHFSVGSASGTFSLSLTDLGADANVRLIRDNDFDHIVDLDEVHRSSNLGGTTSESINAVLNQGDYFVQVYQFSGNTDYTLNLSLSV